MRLSLIRTLALVPPLMLAGCSLDREGGGLGLGSGGASTETDASADGFTPWDAAADSALPPDEAGWPDAHDAGDARDASSDEGGADTGPSDASTDVTTTDTTPDVVSDAGVTVFCEASDPLLAACYRFNNGANIGRDQSQYGNHATVSDVSLVSGVNGSAVRHDAGSSITVADSSSLDVPALTIEMWIRPYALPSDGRAGLFDNDGQYGFFLMAGGTVRCTAGGNSLASTVLVESYVWTHVACTYDGSAMTIYIDGAQADTTAASGPISTQSTVGSSIGSNSPSGDPFDGEIDDLRIWRRARSAKEICEAAGSCD